MEPLINILTRFFLLCASLERFSTSFYYVIKNSAGNKNFYIKFEFKMQNKFRLKRHFSKKHTRGFSYSKFSALSLQSRREETVRKKQTPVEITDNFNARREGGKVCVPGNLNFLSNLFDKLLSHCRQVSNHLKMFLYGTFPLSPFRAA